MRRKFLSLFMALVMFTVFVPCIAMAEITESGECGDNLIWTLDDDGVLTISGTGDMGNYYYHQYAPWYSNRSYIKSVIIEDGVTSIGEYAFYYCENMKSVTIPSSITYIGHSAFYGCTDLRNVYINDLAAWCGISYDSGYYDSPLCYADNLYINNELATDITIPSGVTSIADYAFRGCKSLTSVIIGNGVTSIGNHAFYDCTSLTSITIPDSVISIGSHAFEFCIYLTNIEVPESVTSIGSYAFADCTGLMNVTISNGVASIGDYAFDNCSSLTGIYINDLAAWCNISFGNSSSNPLCYAKNLYINDELATNISIPDTVTAIRSYAFYNCTSLTNIAIPDSVTSIGGSVFYGCVSLTSITIPNSVSSIGGFVFYDCTSLTDVHYIGTWSDFINIKIGPDNTYLYKATLHCSDEPYVYWGSCGNDLIWRLGEDGKLTISGVGDMTNYYVSSSAPWYSYRSSITNVVIEDGVTSVSQNAFNNYTNLINVSLGSSITAIGTSAFIGCTSLQNVYISDMESYLNIDFGSELSNPMCYAHELYLNGERITYIEIPETVTQIPAYAFRGCNTLTDITIPDSVTSIGTSAFSDCTSLTSITIPDGVTSVGNSVFSGCTKLTSITIPNGVASIGNSTFRDCSSLTSITIPGGVTSIGSDMFYNCTSLTSITIPNGVTSIGTYAFYNCTSLTSITIPNGVTSIDSSAFRDCTSLTSVTMPDSVTSIGSFAFRGCTSLTSATMPDNVTSIGSSAFRDCTSLTSVTMPNNITSISNYVFEDCTNLTSITIPGGVASIGTSAFEDCTSLTDVYYAGTWANFISISIDSNNTPFEQATLHCSDKTFVYWDIRGDDLIWGIGEYGELTISGNGDMPDYSSSYLAPWYGYRSSITSVMIEDSITSIGSYAFRNCINLTNIAIPDGITSISDYAFDSCTSLTNVYYSGTFADFIRISIGSNNKCFEDAVHYCSDRTFISYGSCGDNALWFFDNTGTLTISGTGKMTNYSSLSPWHGYRITNVVIEDGITSIGTSAFEDCYDLTSVTIGNSVTSIGRYAFRDCTDLTSITIPDGVTSIGDYAFYWCSDLTSITIPNSVISIGRYAFSGTELNTVTYSGTAEEFSQVYIADGNTNLTSAAFKYFLFVAVTYDYETNGGESSTATKNKIAKGEAADLTPTASKTGWTFIGWNTDPNAETALESYIVNRDITLYAIFEKYITVTYDYITNGGETATATTKTMNADNLVDLTPTASKTGWTFIGWNTDPNAKTALESYIANEDVTLYAIYKKDISASFYSGENTLQEILTADIYNNETEGTINAPLINSYGSWTIDKWRCDTLAQAGDIASGENINIAQGDVYYAVYTRPLTITYDTAGGNMENTYAKITQYYNSYGTESTESFTFTESAERNGCTFIGWEYDGDIYSLNDTISIDKNSTVSAIWKTDEVSSNKCSGTYVMDSSITVTLSSETDNSVIYYTTDGSEPTENSEIFDKDISIEADTTIKAFAKAPNAIPSEISEFTYSKAENPRLININNIYATGAEIRFYQPDGAIDTYVEISVDGGKNWTYDAYRYGNVESVIESVVESDDIIRVSGLLPNTEFMFRIVCVFEDNKLLKSEPFLGTTTDDLSSECKIVKVSYPLSADIDQDSLSITCASLMNMYESVTVDLEVSSGATWDLFLTKNDAIYGINSIEDKTASLASGEISVLFIKVTAEDGQSQKIYSMSVYRQSKSSVPIFSIDAGFVKSGTTLSLSAKGEIIKYTTDGSNPSEINGMIYTEPIVINEDTVGTDGLTIKAVAKESDMDEYSDVVTKIYYINDDISSECDITAINYPEGASIDQNNLYINNAVIAASEQSVEIDLTVSGGASWEIYLSEEEAEKDINSLDSHIVSLTAGEEKLIYIRVTAEDEQTYKIYSMLIERQSEVTIVPTDTPGPTAETTVEPTDEPTETDIPEFQGITMAETENSYIFEIDIDKKPDDCFVYTAIYDESGILISVNKENLDTSDVTSIEIDKSENAFLAKVFIWSDTMKPAIKAAKFDLNRVNGGQ